MPEVPPFPFIVGSGRCGSTLMRVMFDAHPDMAVPTELYFSLAPRAEWLTPDGSLIVDRVVADLEARPWYPRMKLEPGAYRAAIAAEAPTDYADVIRSLYGVYAQAQGKPRYGNKSPGHVASMPQLLALFPEAKFIHIVRDGRNVALSYMEHNFGPSDLAGSAEAWRNRVMRGRRAGAKLGPDRYTEVRYEDLLDDPEGQLRRLWIEPSPGHPFRPLADMCRWWADEFETKSAAAQPEARIDPGLARAGSDLFRGPAGLIRTFGTSVHRPARR